MDGPLKSPYPYFGGKARVASLIWERFGDVRNYVEPFFGSGAVLLERPVPFEGVETINDADGFVSNFWRALKADPDAVAAYADWPVNENDLHARHARLVGRRDSLQARLEGDPEFYDAKVAGWWVWGMACWIGGSFCSGEGPWRVTEADDGTRLLVKSDGPGQGVQRQRVHLSTAGQGVQRRRVHLGGPGQGVNRKLVHLGDAGQGVNRKRVHLFAYFRALADRLRRVRVCCGDWSRVMGDTPTRYAGSPVGVFLDPPYSAEAGRVEDIYRCEDLAVAHAVREWAIAHGDDPHYRICLAGYEGEHAMPDGWRCVAWKTSGGYAKLGNGAGKVNAHRERLWFSPACIRPDSVVQGMLL